MLFELPFDVAREILQPAAQHIKILTEVLDPQSVGLGVMAPDFSAASIKVRASSRWRASCGVRFEREGPCKWAARAASGCRVQPTGRHLQGDREGSSPTSRWEPFNFAQGSRHWRR